MSLRYKLIFFSIIIFVLPGCAVIGSSTYYSAETAKGEIKWTSYYFSHDSDKPDEVIYAQKDITVTIQASPIEDKIYTIGPCILIPLPIVPVFGLLNTIYDGPIVITFGAYESPKAYQLTKANIVVENKILSPIKVEHPKVEISQYVVKQDYEIKSLPLAINKDERMFFLTYDLQAAKTASFDLEFTMVDEAGILILEDKVSFKHNISSYAGCVM